MRLQAPGEYFHIYSRGVHKQTIFEIEADYIRFLFLLLTFQGKLVIRNIGREIKQNVRSRTLNIDVELKKDILRDRNVELVAFCFMPNHFHLLVRELNENGISRYMQRVLTAYAKYFNLRHDKSGYLFQGRYQSVHIDNDRQLMHTSAYIHKNPAEIGLRGKEDEYPWSSYQDYVGVNRFGDLLAIGIIADRFSEKENRSDYRSFVSSSQTKEIKELEVQFK